MRWRYMTDCWLGREQKCLSMRRFLTLYMTVNWHCEFAVNFATFLKVCRDFFTFAPWFSSSPNNSLGPISHRYWDTVTNWPKIANFAQPPSFSALIQGDPVRIYGKALRFLILESSGSWRWRFGNPSLDRFWLIHPCDRRMDRQNCNG